MDDNATSKNRLMRRVVLGVPRRFICLSKIDMPTTINKKLSTKNTLAAAEENMPAGAAVSKINKITYKTPDILSACNVSNGDKNDISIPFFCCIFLYTTSKR